MFKYLLFPIEAPVEVAHTKVPAVGKIVLEDRLYQQLVHVLAVIVASDRDRVLDDDAELQVRNSLVDPGARRADLPLLLT